MTSGHLQKDVGLSNERDPQPGQGGTPNGSGHGLKGMPGQPPPAEDRLRLTSDVPVTWVERSPLQ